MENKRRTTISLSSFFRISLYFVGIFASLILFAITSFTQYRGELKEAQQELKNNSRFAANSISRTLEFYKSQGSIVGRMPAFSAEGASAEIKQQVLHNVASNYDFNSIDMIDSNGYLLSSGKFAGDRDFFIQAQNGNIFITALAEEIGKPGNIENIIISAPVWKNQEVPKIIGAVYVELSSRIIYDSAIFSKSSPQTHFIIFDRYFTPLIVENDINANVHEIVNALKQSQETTTASRKNKAIVARSTISNTDGWQIVLYTPTASILKDFYRTIYAKVLSLLALIIITELTIILINRKVCKPIKQACSQLEKAANGNLTSLSAEEIFVTEADKIVKSASKLIDKLNVSVALEEDVGNSSTLSDLISASVLKNMLDFYGTPQYEGLNLILSDSNGAFLMESNQINGNLTPLKSDLPPIKSIKVESRIVGIIEFQLAENCKINELDARQIITTIGEQLSLLAETNYRQNLHHKSQLAKLQHSIISLAKLNSKILNQLNPLIAKIEETNREELLSLPPIKLEKEKTGIMNTLRLITGQVDKAVESSVSAELINSLTEEPYDVEELVNSIKKIELPEMPRTRCSVNVQAGSNLPETLFGDKKYITRLVMWNEEMLLQKGENNLISVTVDAVKGTYNCNLKITVQSNATCFSSQYMQRIKAYQDGDFMAFGETENLSNISWRLISVMRIVKMQNGTINISQSEQNTTKIEILLPQVEAGRE